MKSTSTKTAPRQRYIIIDLLRGFAVLLMIIFHLAYDLSSFGFVRIDFFGDPLWFAFPRFIVFLFLICVGMGLALVYKYEIAWKKVNKRFFKLAGCALLITFITYILFPRNFIFFGTLHCIAVTSVIGVFFAKRPKLSLALCCVLIASNLAFKPALIFISKWLNVAPTDYIPVYPWIGLVLFGISTLIPISEWLKVAPMDYIPVYPWFGFVLFGIYLESINFHKIPIKSNILIKPLEIIGRHSLKIYLLHQPILYGAIFFLYRLKGSG